METVQFNRGALAATLGEEEEEEEELLRWPLAFGILLQIGIHTQEESTCRSFSLSAFRSFQTSTVGMPAKEQEGRL